jgi:hypothetical protein
MLKTRILGNKDKVDVLEHSDNDKEKNQESMNRT